MPPHGQAKTSPLATKNGNLYDNGGAMPVSTEEARKEEFLRGVFDLMMKKGIKDSTDRKHKVVDFKHPEELRQLLDFGIPQSGDGNKKLLQLCEDITKYSVKTAHPRFFNQLYGGQDIFALAGAWLTETLNGSLYTYEVAPVFTLMEQMVLTKLREIVGYPEGDGIQCAGGSMSNMYGMNLARYNMFPEVKTEGMQGLPKVCVFTSEQCHYSVKKAACLLGMGMNSVRSVPVTARNRMDPQKLEEMILEAKAEGVTPFMVNATAGTTVMGAYDPLDEIADICEKYGIWMHVDSCWGGAVMMSDKHRHLMKGMERSDSLAWNPHKMCGVPQQCSVFLTRHNGLLQKVHSANASYLFQQDKFYDMSYDTGDKSIQCGRKVDVFKFWLMWRAHGCSGMAKNVDHVFDMANHLRERIVSHSNFRMVQDDPQCTNVCFWYVPPSLNGKPQTEEWWQKLGKVAPVIKERMIKCGSMMIGYQPLGDKVNFFRFVLANPASTSEDMDFIISEIERLGHDL